MRTQVEKESREPDSKRSAVSRDGEPLSWKGISKSWLPGLAGVGTNEPKCPFLPESPMSLICPPNQYRPSPPVLRHLKWGRIDAFF